jgi:hypothetical protein
MLTELQIYHKTNWEDYTVLDTELYETEIYIDNVFASNTLVSVALNNFKYNGYDGKGYSVGTATRGITEEEAYNICGHNFKGSCKQTKFYSCSNYSSIGRLR